MSISVWFDRMPAVRRWTQVVGIADMAISAEQSDTLITYALGSCLGIAIHDPGRSVGGLIHVMLPESNLDSSSPAFNPFKFVDTGLPRLFKECYKLGGRKEHMIVKVAGGATGRMEGESDFFEIGKRNLVMLRKMLWRNGVLLTAEDVGGNYPRTMSLDIGSGEVVIKTSSSFKFL